MNWVACNYFSNDSVINIAINALSILLEISHMLSLYGNVIVYVVLHKKWTRVDGIDLESVKMILLIDNSY